VNTDTTLLAHANDGWETEHSRRSHTRLRLALPSRGEVFRRACPHPGATRDREMAN
jgi:hypothetical protein